MKNRLQHSAGDRPRLVGNRITITPFATGINVAGFGALLNLNAVAEKPANLTGDLGFDTFTVYLRDRLANFDHVADRSKRFENPGLRHPENSGCGMPIHWSGYPGVGLCGATPDNPT